MQYGAMRARSIRDLEALLLSNDIALLQAQAVTWKPTFVYRIRSYMVIAFFQQLLILLDAGVHLHKALFLLATQTQPAWWADIIDHIAISVERGSSLSHALAQFPHVFNDLMIQFSAVGQASNLIYALRLLVEYLEQQQAVYKKLRSVLMLPCVTLVCFVGVALIILLAIVPRFETMFATVHIPLSSLTKIIFTVSHFLRSSKALCILISISLTIVISRSILLYHKKARFMYYTLLLKIPYCNSILITQANALFFNAFGTLLQAEVPIVRALTLASTTVTNSVIAYDLLYLVPAVRSGKPLSQALSQTLYILPDASALITLGEESGNIGILVARLGKIYNDRLVGLLTFFAIIIQPLVLLVLAVGILLLMLAVYVPILSLSHNLSV